MKKMGFDIDLLSIPDGAFKRFVNYCHENEFTEQSPGVIINGLPFYFNFKAKKIGLAFSGGTDSSLMMYFLCKIIHTFELKTKIYPICVVRNWEQGDHQTEAKRNVIAYLNSKFPNIIQDITWSFLPNAFDHTPVTNLVLNEREKNLPLNPLALADVYYFQMFEIWAAKKHSLDAVYSGTTTNPAFSDESVAGPTFRRPTNVRMENFSLYQGPSNKLGVWYASHAPFEFIDKPWIIAQYKNFDIEDLLTLTKSCEVATLGCGACFHCEERQWGLDNAHIFWEKLSAPISVCV